MKEAICAECGKPVVQVTGGWSHADMWAAQTHRADPVRDEEGFVK